MITGNLLDYAAWRGDLSRESHPFGPVDWMIFARLSYAPMTYLYLDEEEAAVPLPVLMDQLLYDEHIHDYVRRKEDFALFEILRDSPRYRDLCITNFVDVFNEEKEIQFSAYTLLFPEGEAGLVFKGTDETVVGWK